LTNNDTIPDYKREGWVGRPLEPCWDNMTVQVSMLYNMLFILLVKIKKIMLPLKYNF
jgi:hypothetical protein